MSQGEPDLGDGIEWVRSVRIKRERRTQNGRRYGDNDGIGLYVGLTRVVKMQHIRVFFSRGYGIVEDTSIIEVGGMQENRSVVAAGFVGTHQENTGERKSCGDVPSESYTFLQEFVVNRRDGYRTCGEIHTPVIYLPFSAGIILPHDVALFSIESGMWKAGQARRL